LERLTVRVFELLDEADKTRMTSSRVGYLAAAEKLKEAALVADRIGGQSGASIRAHADQVLSNVMLLLRDMPAAVRAACSSLRAARSAGCRTSLIRGLAAAYPVTKYAPHEMAMAECESREQERHSGSFPSYGLDLSMEGLVSLPMTAVAIRRLGLAYSEVAVEICDAALAEAGGRGSPAAADEQRVPSLRVEAQSRSRLGLCLDTLGEQRQRSLELLEQAVALLRQDVQAAAPGDAAMGEKRALAVELSNLGDVMQNSPAEAEKHLREALELSEETNDVKLKQVVLTSLANLSCEPDQPVGLAEAAALRSRLNQLYLQNGRIPDTTCTICLEPLEQPNDGEDEGPAGDDCHQADDSSVRVLPNCGHQFHYGCLSTWWDTRLERGACPICKK